jgi:hypothetical protein
MVPLLANVAGFSQMKELLSRSNRHAPEQPGV